MRLTDHVTLNFNNNTSMSTAAVFLDIEKAFDTAWHSGLLYKLSKLEFSTNLIKLISSFLSQRKFIVSVEGEMSTPREMRAGVPQVSVLSPTLCNRFINDAPQAPGVYLEWLLFHSAEILLPMYVFLLPHTQCYPLSLLASCLNLELFHTLIVLCLLLRAVFSELKV
jgi:hypothetical protein